MRGGRDRLRRHSTKLIERKGKSLGYRRHSDVRVRHRPVAVAVEPADARRGPLGDEPGRDRDRPRRRTTSTSEVGDAIASRRWSRCGKFMLVGIAKFGTSTRSAARPSPSSTIPTAQELLDRKNARRDLGLGEAGRLARAPGRGDQAAAAVERPGPDAARSRRRADRRHSRRSRSSSSYFLLAFAASRSSSARSSSSTRSRSRSPSGRASSRPCGRSAPPGGRCSARCFEGLVIGALASIVGLFLGLLIAQGLNCSA